MTDILDPAAALDAHGPAIPGLRFRPFAGPDDWAGMAELIRAAARADGDDYMPSPETLQADTEHRPNFVTARDLLIAEVDGRMVARADGWFAVRDGRPVHHIDGSVHPDWRRRGIGRAMLAWNEARARAFAGTDPAARGPDAVTSAWVSEIDPGGAALYEATGYAAYRYAFLMIRPRLDDVEEPPLPDGLELRPVRDADHRRIWEAEDEAFRDHFEHRTQSDADFVAHFAQPDLDTSLWRVAWDGDEVAGVVQSWIWADENEALGVRRGWLERISVRRPWRRRGLGRALTAAALVGLRERGMTEAMLGVDAENPTGALGLYRAVGFEVRHRVTGYRKPLTLPGDGTGDG